MKNIQIEDKRISYKTALLADKKGLSKDLTINRIVNMHYYNYQGVLNGNSLMQLKHRDDPKYRNIVAPTQSVLSEWLLKKHSIYVDVTLEENGYDYRIKRIININDDDTFNIEELYAPKSYELRIKRTIDKDEVYEHALYTALGLIENK